MEEEIENNLENKPDLVQDGYVSLDTQDGLFMVPKVDNLYTPGIVDNDMSKSFQISPIVSRFIRYGDEKLTKPSTNIEEVTEEIIKDAQEMANFLTSTEAYGLTYSQLGVLKKMFVLNRKVLPEEYSNIFINCELATILSGETERDYEGCISLYGLGVNNIERYKEIQVKYQDLNGKEYLLSAGGLLARILQHELDHQQGTLIIDRCSRLEKNTVLKKIKNIKKRA